MQKQRIAAVVTGSAMTNRLFGVALSAVVAVFGAGRGVAAQESVQLGASYDLLYREFEENTPRGAHFDVAKPMGTWSLVGEISFNKYDEATVQSYQGGLRFFPFNPASMSARPFVQVTTGLWHCCGVDAFVLQTGAGVEFGSSSKFKYRAQFDYRSLHSEGDSMRVSAGVVVKLE